MSNIYTGPAEYGQTDNTLLIQIATALQGGGTTGGVPTSLAGTQRTLTMTAATTGSGTVAAGARSVLFVSSSGFTGTIATGAYPASTPTQLTAPLNDTLPSIAYTVGAGTLYIWVLK